MNEWGRSGQDASGRKDIPNNPAAGNGSIGNAGDRPKERSPARRADNLCNETAVSTRHVLSADGDTAGNEATGEKTVDNEAAESRGQALSMILRNGEAAQSSTDRAEVERSNVTRWRALRIEEDGIPHELEDDIASECALTVMLNGEEYGTIVCSPTHKEELVYGFLASEGAIRSASQVNKLEIDEERGFAYAVLNGDPLISGERSSRRFVGSCCGKGRQFYFQGDMLTARTVMTRMTVTAEQIWTLMARLQRSSTDFASTGGVHNAALCTPNELLAVRTDIGRHNALDKLYGYSLLRNMRMSDKLIAFSGRLSSEVVLKAAKMGCGLLLSKSAPTDLALKLADELGITCIGFIRDRRLSVYTHRERLIITGQ